MNLRSLFLNNLTTKQTIFKNTFWLMIAEGFSKLFGFLLTIVTARYLRAEGYGVLGFATSFVAMFAVFAEFGLSTITIREVARNKKLAQKYTDNILGLKLFLSLILFCLIIISIQFLGKTTEARTVVYLVAIWLFMQNFFQFFQAIFCAFEKMEYEAFSKIAYSILRFMVVGFVLWQKLGMILLVVSYIVTSFLALIFISSLVRIKFIKFWAKFDFDFWKYLLKEAWPLTLIYGMSMIYSQFSIFLLSWLKGDLQTGLYRASSDLIFGLAIIPIILNRTVFPYLSRNFVKQNEKKFRENYGKIFRYLLVVNISIALLVFLFARHLILILFGDDYTGAIAITRVLVFAGFFSYMDYLLQDSLIAFNDQRFVAKVIISGTIFNIALNIILIPLYSSIGAAVAISVAGLAVTATFYIQVMKKMKVLPA